MKSITLNILQPQAFNSFTPTPTQKRINSNLGLLAIGIVITGVIIYYQFQKMEEERLKYIKIAQQKHSLNW